MHLLNNFPIRFNRKKIIILIFIILGLYQLWSLMRWPSPFVDEAWLISRSWTYLETDKAYGVLDQGFMDNLEGYWTFFPLIQPWLYAVALKIAGHPSLFAARMVSYVFGLLLLISIWWIGKYFGSIKFATLGVILVGFSYPYNYSSHLARSDIIAASFAYGSIAFLLNNKKENWLFNVIAGLMMGLALENHPNSMIFFPTILTLFLIQYKLRFLKSPTVWFFSVGVLLGILCYSCLHIFPFPNTYRTITEFFSSGYVPPLFSFNLETIIFSFHKTFIYWGIRYFLSLPLVLIAIFRMLKSRNHKDKYLAAIIITMVGSYILLISNKFIYYEIFIAPLLHISIAWFLNNLLIKRKNNSRKGNFTTVYSITAIVVLLYFSNIQMAANTQNDYRYVQNRINQSIEDSDVIIGPQTYWLGLTKNQYYSWQQIPWSMRYNGNTSLEETFLSFKPDILILDAHVDNFIRDTPEELPYSGLLWVPKDEMMKFLDQHAVLIDSFENKEYRYVNIYRINW